MTVPKDINILIVDDFFSVRKIIKSSLRDYGFMGLIFEAENVADAQKILNEQKLTEYPVKMILSDWEMPGESGLDFLKKVRSNDEFKGLPFLMITTVNEKDNVLSAIQAGASNYLTKPWSKADFEKKIEAVWNKHHKG